MKKPPTNLEAAALDYVDAARASAVWAAEHFGRLSEFQDDPERLALQRAETSARVALFSAADEFRR